MPVSVGAGKRHPRARQRSQACSLQVRAAERRLVTSSSEEEPISRHGYDVTGKSSSCTSVSQCRSKIKKKPGVEKEAMLWVYPEVHGSGAALTFSSQGSDCFMCGFVMCRSSVATNESMRFDQKAPAAVWRLHPSPSLWFIKVR